MVGQIGAAARHIGIVLSCACVLAGATGCNDGQGSSITARGPAINGTPATNATVGRKYSFTPQLSTAGSASLGLSIENKPAWASFDTATGELSGTPTSADLGSYPNILIVASDGQYSNALAPFSIWVAEPGTVTLSWQAPSQNTDGTALTDLAGYTINYGTNASALDASVTIDSPTTTTYTLQNLSSGVWYFAVGAYTSGGAQSDLSGVGSTTVD